MTTLEKIMEIVNESDVKILFSRGTMDGQIVISMLKCENSKWLRADEIIKKDLLIPIDTDHRVSTALDFCLRKIIKAVANIGGNRS